MSQLYNDDGTLVHAFKGHSDVVNSVAATPDGQHIISGSIDELVKVWSVANKSLVSTCEGHHQRFRGGGDARRPAHPQRLVRTGPSACGCSTAPSRTPSGRAPSTREGPRRCPTTSTRSPARATGPSSSSTSTTAPFCAPSSTTQPGCTAWRCCPTASASSAARPTTAPPASPTTASRREQKLKPLSRHHTIPLSPWYMSRRTRHRLPSFGRLLGGVYDEAAGDTDGNRLRDVEEDLRRRRELVVRRRRHDLLVVLDDEPRQTSL